MPDNPLHHSVPIDKRLGNPLMSADGPGPEHGTHHYGDSFKTPNKPDLSATFRVRAVRRGLHADQIREPGEEFDCPVGHLALVSESAPGVGWQELVNPLDLVRHRLRARRPVGKVQSDSTDFPPRAA